MANEEHLKILKQGVEVWNTWREENSNVIPDLRMANLHGAYLIGAYLMRAGLHGAYLIGANLSGADLSRADFSGAYLMKADLSRGDLAVGWRRCGSSSWQWRWTPSSGTTCPRIS